MSTDEKKSQLTWQFRATVLAGEVGWNSVSSTVDSNDGTSELPKLRFANCWASAVQAPWVVQEASAVQDPRVFRKPV